MNCFEKGKWYLISQQSSRYVNIVLCKEESDAPYRLKGEMYISVKGDGHIPRPRFSESSGEWSDIESYQQIEQSDSRIQNYLPSDHKYKLIIMKRKLIGYKLKQDCKKYENAIKAILNTSWWDEYAQSNLREKGWMFASDWGTNVIAIGAQLKQAGVLSLWFEPVYKSSEEIVTLSNGGNVKINKGKIEVEGKNITIEGLQNLVNDFGPQEWPGIPWPVTVNETIRIGCWGEVTKQDLELVIKTYHKINS